MDLTETERTEIGRQISVKRRQEFGSKSAAYQQAGVNAATWDRIEAGLPVREDRLIAAVKLLWPVTGGDWSRIPKVTEPLDMPVFPGNYDDPDYLGKVETWVMELQERIEVLEGTVGKLLDAGAASGVESLDEARRRRTVSEASSTVPEQRVAMDDPDLLSEREAQIEDP